MRNRPIISRKRPNMAFFRMVLQKLAFSGKRGRFKAKSHEIKVVGNEILKTFYLKESGQD